MIKATQGNILPNISAKKIAWCAHLLFLYLLFLPLSSYAEDLTYSVFLEDHSWTEIDQDIKKGTQNIIVPVGGTEQSGPYISVGKHNKRVTYLAGIIAKKLGRTFVAPTISYVPEGQVAPRTSHMRFAGTISISLATFKNLICDIAQSLKVQGFRHIILLGDHGSYQHMLQETAQQLNKSWENTPYHVFYIGSFYRVAYKEYPQWLRQQGYHVDQKQHADIVDTSLTLASSPQDVRYDQIKQAHAFRPNEGIYGASPQDASKQLGTKGLDMQIQAALKEIASLNNDASF